MWSLIKSKITDLLSHRDVSDISSIKTTYEWDEEIVIRPPKYISDTRVDIIENPSKGERTIRIYFLTDKGDWKLNAKKDTSDDVELH